MKLVVGLAMIAVWCGTTGAQTGSVEVGVAGGAAYRMDVPANWNHSLVVYYHGYAEAPTRFSKDQGVGAMKPLLDRGYAVVQSGFSVTGWALPQAYAETEALRVAFGKAHGEPKETFVTGYSMGGALTMMTMERNPGPYAGALDLCGAVVPANEWAARRFALRAAFDFYFPGVLPSLTPAPKDYVETKETGEAVLAALRGKPEDAEKMRRLSGEYRDEDVAHLMQYVEFQASDFARKAGGSVVDTRNWIYTGTGSAEEDYRLNDGVTRYAADPAARRWLVENYSGTGRLKKPMLAVHTVNDPLIPAGTLEVYAERVAEAGDADRFVQQYVDHTGHCAISGDEVGRAFDELVGWVHGGEETGGRQAALGFGMLREMALPATFNDFVGNDGVVESLRVAIAGGRLPPSMIVSGAAGAGKYTLALMLAMAVECERQPRDLWSTGQTLASFCGVCGNCVRIAGASELEEQVAAAVEAREGLRETDKKETRVLVQPHPDVLVIPPDPPQMLIKIGQVRTVIQRAQRLPSEGPRRIFIFTAANFMKEAANSLLKVLEEPPATVHLMILAENTGELLPTIRSRCAMVRLGALPVEAIEMLLADRRPEVPSAQRALIARLAQGAAGRAMGFDLAGYTAARADAMLMLRGAAEAASGKGDAEHTALFKMTETYRAGAEGQQKTVALVRGMTLLLEDVMLLRAGTPELVRNIDLRGELEKLAGMVSFAWIERAGRGLDQVTSGMRRNLLRNLSLDAFATSLEG